MIPDIHNLIEYKFGFIHERMRVLARDLGFEFVDLLPIMKGHRPEELWAMSGDPHPNALGHQLVAEALYPAVFSPGRAELGLYCSVRQLFCFPAILFSIPLRRSTALSQLLDHHRELHFLCLVETRIRPGFPIFLWSLPIAERDGCNMPLIKGHASPAS
jgi:hypothetical protein